MVTEHVTEQALAPVERPSIDGVPPVINDEPPRTIIPPAFYRDDEPPEPPDGDPHWREFPFFNDMKKSHLVVIGVVSGVLLVTLAHLAILFFI